MRALRPNERAVLDVLVSANGRVVSRERLTLRAGLQDVSVRRADSIIVELRRVLGQHAIRTVRGRGWCLNGDVALAARGEAP